MKKLSLVLSILLFVTTSVQASFKVYSYIEDHKTGTNCYKILTVITNTDKDGREWVVSKGSVWIGSDCPKELLTPGIGDRLSNPANSNNHGNQSSNSTEFSYVEFGEIMKDPNVVAAVDISREFALNSDGIRQSYYVDKFKNQTVLLKVYPNPATNVLGFAVDVLEIIEPVTIVLSDLHGQNLLHWSVQNKTEKFSTYLNLIPGEYMVTLKTSKEILESHKIVIK